MTALRQQLDDMKLSAEDNTTELELRRAQDSLTALREQLDSSETKVLFWNAKKAKLQHDNKHKYNKPLMGNDAQLVYADYVFGYGYDLRHPG